MKKILLSSAAIALVAAFAMPAHAECDGWYGALRAGVVQHDVSDSGDIADISGDNLDDNRLMISGALGYRYEHFRGELEYVWRKHTDEEVTNEGLTDTMKFKSYSYMFNVYYDLLPYNWWSPYVGAGLGYTRLKYNNVDTLWDYSNAKYKEGNFTWALGAGVSVKVTNRFNVDLGYRYYDMGKMKHADITAQELYGGVRYVF